MIELYQKEECPFCQKVRQKLQELELDYVNRISVKGTQQRDIMVKLGGEHKVPFLVDQSKGVMMYESDDIVAYLEKEYGNSQKESSDEGGTCPA